MCRAWVPYIYHFLCPPHRRGDRAEPDGHWLHLDSEIVYIRDYTHTNFNFAGVEFGRHDADLVVLLCSAWLVMVSDEPRFGTTDYCCTFTAKGTKERGRSTATSAFILAMKINARVG